MISVAPHAGHATGTPVLAAVPGSAVWHLSQRRIAIVREEKGYCL